MEYFVHPHSVVRKIWGKPDIILFIFAGASAEFALNKAVDWLYFTGRLPADPIGRLFSTVEYARKIVFSTTDDALHAIDAISAIHGKVEANRGAQIPQWAYRDVLFMLIHYSITAFELLERKMNGDELEEAFDVFGRVGQRMQISDLPSDYAQWLKERALHMQHDLLRSHFTDDLFRQYKKHLGNIRFRILVEAQKLVVPDFVSGLMEWRQVKWLKPFVPIYKFLKTIRLDGIVSSLLLPAAYKSRILALGRTVAAGD